MRYALGLIALLLLAAPCGAQETQSVAPRPCVANQGCQLYYTYADFAARDFEGNPVIDPSTGKQIDTIVCILWKSYYTRIDNPDVDITGTNFYDKYSYRVYPRAHRIIVYSIEAPRVAAIKSGTGWFPLGGEIAFPVNLVAPLYAQPQSNWPCSKETWAAALNTPDRELVPPSGGGGAPIHIGPGPIHRTVPPRPHCAPSANTMGGLYCD